MLKFSDRGLSSVDGSGFESRIDIVLLKMSACFEMLSLDTTTCFDNDEDAGPIAAVISSENEDLLPKNFSYIG